MCGKSLRRQAWRPDMVASIFLNAGFELRLLSARAPALRLRAPGLKLAYCVAMVTFVCDCTLSMVTTSAWFPGVNPVGTRRFI